MLEFPDVPERFSGESAWRSCRRFGALGLALLLFAAGQLYAAAPRLTKLEPRGGQRGRAVKLTLIGRGLTEQARIDASLPGAITPLAPPKQMQRRGRELAFLVELEADAPVGVYPVRIESPEGMSNVLLFSVGVFPEISEEESQQLDPDPDPLNENPETAQAVPVPSTVNGTLTGPDRDYYRIEAPAQKRLVLEVESRRIGSAIDPRIEVYDEAGARLAWNDDAPGIGVDARVDVTFPKAGTYFVGVRDSKFSEQNADFYRLKIGSYSYADGIFPLGWQRGGEVEIELLGGNLPQTARVRPNLQPSDPAAEFVTVHAPGEPGALPLRFALSGRPEILEPTGSKIAEIPPRTVVNGRISEPGQKDSYRLAVEPGQRWQIDLQAAKLGTSRLYGVITVYGAKDEILASTRDVGVSERLSNLDVSEDSGIDQFLQFEVPKQARDVRVEVEDLLGRAGPDYGYRLSAQEQTGDFSLTLVTQELNIPLRGSAVLEIQAERRGYDGPLKLSIPDLPDDLMVDGGNIPKYEVPGSSRLGSTGLLTITPKPGATPRALNLEIWGEAVIDGEVVQRRARGAGLETNVNSDNDRARRARGFSTNVAPWLGMDLPATVVKEQAAVLEIMSPRYMRLIPGLKYELDWALHARQKGIRPPEAIGVRKTPNVRTFNRLRKGDRGKKSGTFDVGSQLGWGPGKYDIVLTAKMEIDGREETIYSPAVEVDVVYAYEIKPSPEVTQVKPGSEVELVAKIQREAGFTSVVEIKPENLPLDVDCEPGVVEPESEELRLACKVGSKAVPGSYEIDLASSSTVVGDDGKKIPISQPAVKAMLKIGDGKAVGVQEERGRGPRRAVALNPPAPKSLPR